MTTPFLPTPGGSSNVWATELNNFLNVAHESDGTVKGGLIALVAYSAPTTQITYGATTTWAIMDGTHLTVTFTVPASGNVYIDVGMDWAFASVGLSAPVDVFLGLCAHGSTATIYAAQSWFGNNNSIVAGAHSTHRYYITGLTPQASVQMDLCIGLSGSPGGGGYADFYVYPVSGDTVLSNDPAEPVLIQVFAA